VPKVVRRLPPVVLRGLIVVGIVAIVPLLAS